MNHQLYRMHDQTPNGMTLTNHLEAPLWNERGYGIFMTVNDFGDEPRRIGNLKKINAYAIDLDEGSKDFMLEKIRSGFEPTMVVETKRGYHVWWQVEDADPHYWNAIMLDRLVPYYGADKNARDMARVLRAPGYQHVKVPTEPFEIKIVHNSGLKYKQLQFVMRYPDKFQDDRNNFVLANEKEFSGSKNFWEKVWRLDCMEALTRISGSSFVNGDDFCFHLNANGNFNVSVSGIKRSFWIDQHFRIGSFSKGGPTMFQFLKWYGHKPTAVIDFLKGNFSELSDD